MQVFVSEFLTGGGLPECERNPSLLAEGRAMLAAAVADLSRLPALSVLTTLAPEVTFRSDLPGTVTVVDCPGDWPVAFDACCRRSDATLVIAPETGGVLASLVRWVEELGRPVWNSRPEAIEICTDKLTLAGRLAAAGVRTIPTELVEWNCPPVHYPLVVKPRDGAGSQLTQRVDSLADWRKFQGEYALQQMAEPVWQPFVAGRNLSMGAVFPLIGHGSPTFLPLAEQHLTNDGRLAYQGGRLPADVSETAVERCREMIRRAADTVEGLKGYVGFDLLLPEDGQEEPVLVEINPRLTTSFVGYARLCPVPLASLWLDPPECELMWPARSVSFSAAGKVVEESLP